MDLVILDGGNFPIVAFHCCLVIKESRSEFETEINLLGYYDDDSLDMLNIFSQWG
jgi:hypothetical protein